MEIIAYKYVKRKLEEGKETQFSVRKRPVDPRKITRFIKEHDIPDGHSHMSRKCFEAICPRVLS